jgi:hypothetical protein
MRNNKILATAITTALVGSLSVGGVNAGITKVTYPAGEIGPPMSVATEEIDVNQLLPFTCSATSTTSVLIAVDYTLSDTGEKLDLNDLITLELYEGTSLAETAVFKTNTDTAATTISPGALTIKSKGGGSSGTFALSSGGEGTNTLQFIAQSGGVTEGSTLTFSFCVDKADILKEQGQSIGINLTMTNGKSASQVILNSAQGSQATINGGKDDGKVKVNIGSDAGAKKLTGSSISEDTAILGKICLSENKTAGGLYKENLLELWSFGLTDYQLSVSDAPFNASIGHVYAPALPATPTDEEKAGVMVFLDLDDNGTFDATDIPATTVTTTGATFDINSTDDPGYIASLSPDGAEVCPNLVFKVSGNDEIKTQKNTAHG